MARTAAPLGLDFHVGLDDSQFGRVAHMALEQGSLGDAAAQRMLKTMMSEPLALTTRCLHQSAVDPHQHQQAGMATHAATGRQWPWQRARARRLL